MNPLRIKLENFMNHTNSDIDCSQFRSALIVAKNKTNERESNGVGKTTVLSAIDYALFGKVPTNKLEKIVRYGTKKCLVTFDFELDNNIYRIVRGRSASGNKSELKLFQKINDKWVSQDERSASETSEQITKLIKLNYKAFLYSIKFAQEELTALSSVDKPVKRKDMLKEPFQLDPYTKLHKLTEPHVKQTKKDIESTESTISLLGDPDSEIKAAESEVTYCKDLIIRKETNIEKLNITLGQKKAALADLKSTLNSSDSNIHENISQLEIQEKKLKSSIKNSYSTVQDSEKSIDSGRVEISNLNEKLEKLNQKLTDLNNKDIRDKAEIKKQLSKVSDDEVYGTKILARLEAEFDQANKNLPNGDICPTCEQTITAEHRKRHEDEINKLLEEKSEQIKITKTNLTKCKNKKSKLEKELEEASVHEKQLYTVEENIKSAKSQLELRNKNVESAEKRLVQSTNEMDKFQSELKGVQERLNSLKENAKSSSVSELNDKIFALNDEIRVFERGSQEVQQELANAKAKLGVSKDRIENGKKNLEKLNNLKKHLKKLKHDLNIQQTVLNAFSSEGIPTFIINNALNDLQLEANQWISLLRPELGLQIHKDLEITYTVNGIEQSYDQLSKGQRTYIALALKLGLSRLIQHRLGINIGFLELDEVDAVLDDAGVDALVEVIKKLEKTFKIFVVTHNKDLKDHFSHAILVEGDANNGASARVVTSW